MKSIIIIIVLMIWVIITICMAISIICYLLVIIFDNENHWFSIPKRLIDKL